MRVHLAVRQPLTHDEGSLNARELINMANTIATAEIQNGVTVERGDFVVYQGSLSRYSGWVMRITFIAPDGHMNLTDGCGTRLTNVRRTSVRWAANL